MATMFHEIDREDVLPSVQAWESVSESWHFHMLSPSCVFNPTSGRNHCIVLENCSTAETHILLCEFQDMALGRELARMIHPDVFEATPQAPTAPWVVAWEKRMQHLNTVGVPWHHHMLFPECELNSYTNKWVLVFEDPESSKPLVECFASKPSSEFVTIERLYWAQR